MIDRMCTDSVGGLIGIQCREYRCSISAMTFGLMVCSAVL